MLRVDELVSRVENAIDFGLDIERVRKNSNPIPRTKLWNTNILKIYGMSNAEVRIFLNELVKEDTNYLEIGLYKGSTFISAMYGNNPSLSIGIDSFCEFEQENGNNILNTFLLNCKIFNIKKYFLIRKDSFNLDNQERDIIKDINLYFYDGGHSHHDHFLSLKYYYNCLSKNFIFIVDDWAHPEARSGTNLGISGCNFKVHKEWELGKSQHDNSPGLNWHNGLYVAVLEKQ